MTQTVLSSTSSYCTPARTTIRCDWRTLGDLLSDEGQRLASQSAVELSPVLAALLRAASGELESAALVGGRYTPTDLRAIADAVPATNATELLADVVAGLLLRRVMRRRPDDRPLPELAKEAAEWMSRLSGGEAIFPTVETADAGVVDSVVEGARTIERREQATYQAKRLFGRRADRSDPRRQSS